MDGIILAALAGVLLIVGAFLYMKFRERFEVGLRRIHASAISAEESRYSA